MNTFKWNLIKFIVIIWIEMEISKLLGFGLKWKFYGFYLFFFAQYNYYYGIN